MTHMILALIVFLSACSSSQKKDTNVQINSSVSPDKILIVYLSRTNNTKTIAEIIQRHVGGKLVALELETPYPQNYRETVQQVVQENESGYLPPLKTKIDSIRNFDVVFV